MSSLGDSLASPPDQEVEDPAAESAVSGGASSVHQQNYQNDFRRARHKISLDGNAMDHGDMLHVLRQARETPPIQASFSPKKRNQPTSLSFDEVTFDADIAAAVMDVLQQHTTPVWDRMDIEFCVGGRHLASILDVAFILNKVRHLFLASDSAQEVDRTFVTACTVLRVQTSLHSLWLLVPLSTRVSLAVGESISINRTLTKLSLSGSSFVTLKAVHALANGLRDNDAIRTLDFSCCGLDDERLQILISALIRHPSLQILDLSRNHARELATQALAHMLRNPESELHTIDLREQFVEDPAQGEANSGKPENAANGASLDDDEVGDYMTPLASSSSAASGEQELDISEIARSLQNNERLETLRLAQNRLTDRQVLELAECLKTNDTLSELDLQWNKISDRGVNMFTTTLKDLTGLQVLLLGGNDFGQEGTKLLEQLDDDDNSICTVNEQAFKKSYAAKSGSYLLSAVGRRG